MKLIKLSDTHYIVVDDSEIKDCYYYNSLDKAIRFGNNLNHPYHHKIIYSTENFGAGWQQKVMQLSLPEVEETIYGYDVEKMSINAASNTYSSIWRNGFRTHQELVKDKLFTVDDMKKAINLTYELCDRFSDYIVRDRKVYVQQPTIDQENEIIQSLLPKTEWGIEIVDNKIKLL